FLPERHTGFPSPAHQYDVPVRGPDGPGHRPLLFGNTLQNRSKTAPCGFPVLKFEYTEKIYTGRLSFRTTPKNFATRIPGRVPKSGTLPRDVRQTAPIQNTRGNPEKHCTGQSHLPEKPYRPFENGFRVRLRYSPASATSRPPWRCRSW